MSTLTRTPWAATLVAVVLLVAACGGGGSATSPTSSSSATTQGAASGEGSSRQARLPAASGLVAAVDGTTLQVQGNNTQTAVSYTSRTTFTAQVAAVPADVVVGACVAVRSETAPGTPSSTGAAESTQPVAADSVTITPAVDGECAGGFGRGGAGGLPGGAGPGAPPGGAVPSGGPSGTRTGRPTEGAMGGRPGGFGGAFGKVTATGASGFTVTSTVVERPAGTGTASPGSSPTGQVRVVTVTTSARTTYTKTVPTTAKAAAVGTCVTAEGTADDTGAIAATSVAVRPAENGSCTQGFARGAAPTGATNG